MNEETSQPLSIDQLAAISDEALDNVYHYGRSKPGNTFGWQANLKSAEFAKKIIDSGETDIEKIADSIHKGWNETAKKFVENPDQFDDTEKLKASGKLQAKLEQRKKLMNIEYAQLPEDEKEKDRVVAVALLDAIDGEETLSEDDVGGIMLEDLLDEKKKKKKKRDACYYKVKARYKVWPSAYASGALVKCRKKGAKNWGTKTETKNMKKEQLRKLIREMVIAEMGNKEIDKTIDTIGDYEIYQPGEYYEHDPEYGTDSTPFAVRNKNTKQKVKGSDGQYYYHPDNRYYLNYGVDEKGDGLSFSTGKELVAYLKRQETQMNEADECWECYEAAMEEGINEAYEECYRKTNWNMVPEGEEHTCEGDEFYEIYGDIRYEKERIEEAEYRGRKVKLGVPMRGDVKKSKVFVKKPNGKVVKVNFGDKNMRIKKSNPKRRKSFKARHKCSNPGPRWKAKYWSCRAW